MIDTKQIVKEYIHDLSAIPQTDPLVTIPQISCVSVNHLHQVEQFKLDYSSQLIPIIKQAQLLIRESDVNPLCLVHSVIEWQQNGQTVESPCILIPMEFKLDKVTNQIQFITHYEKAELNPFIRYAFAEQFDELLPDFLEINLEIILSELQERITFRNLPVQLKHVSFIGNFHYHRFHLLRELEGIHRSDEPTDLLNAFLGNNESTVEPIYLSPDLLTPADSDQLAIFKAFQNENVVVQGPPGTGKSQVLTNVLGKNLFQQTKTLVLSEKKVALEVLVKKLAAVDLDAFAFIVHSQTSARDLIVQLKSSWNMLELLSFNYPTNLRLSEQHLSSLQLLMDRLNQVDLMGGVSLETFEQLAEESPYEKAVLTTNVPLVSEWLENKSTLERLTNEKGSLAHLQGYKAAFFQQFNGDQLIHRLLKLIELLQPILNEGTWNEMLYLETLIGRCQLVENELFKLYTQLQNKPREKKRFENAVNRFSVLEKSILEQEKELRIWKEIPTKIQIDSWAQATGFWENRKRIKAIHSCLKDKSVNIDVALKVWSEWWELKTELLSLSTLFIEWGIEPSMGHVAASWSVYQSMLNESESALADLASWEPEKRKSLLRFQTELIQLKTELRRNFTINEKEIVSEFLTQKLEAFDSLSNDFKEIQSLPDWLFSLLDQASSLNEIQALILKGNKAKITAHFPELAQFTGDHLKAKLEQLISCEAEEFQLFAQQILMKIKQRFDHYEMLLRLPSTKVKGEEKELRSRLKKGKAILVKEFGKTRHHQSIRSLLESEAGEWIQLLLPVWLSTPNQVADHFPLKPEVFDVLVVDEASQMPLPHVFGSMFRSKRALIAGDDQQMSPSSFFGKKLKGHDVLHQANFSFKRLALRHHYRSAFPDLIAFSNKHFYNNDLIVYPSANLQVSLFRHYFPDGVFSERTNEVEATAIAAFLETFDFTQTLGIVAFSEEQVKCIWKKCSSNVQLKITEGQEQNTVFIKSLEQVQGDEADVLLVSLAYAKNEEGDFHMRFGPLNQEMGYKRLNVLFTRAKTAFHLYCTVLAADFSVSTNESVNLLRLFLHDLEQQTEQDQLHYSFPYGIHVSTQNGTRLTLKSVYRTITSAHDLLTFYRVMQLRGWQLNF